MSPEPTKKNRPTPPHRSGAPVRTCIGCRRRRADHDLVRVAVIDDKPVIGQRGPGRGAWICADNACIDHAERSQAFSRAFRSKLADRLFADTLRGWLGKPAH